MSRQYKGDSCTVTSMIRRVSSFIGPLRRGRKKGKRKVLIKAALEMTISQPAAGAIACGVDSQCPVSGSIPCRGAGPRGWMRIGGSDRG